jgi:hypothetical protein
MDRFPLRDLLDAPGVARGNEAGLRAVALRHRRRRARTARMVGGAAVVLVAGGGIGAAVLGDRAPRSRTAAIGPTPTTVAPVSNELPGGLHWEVAPVTGVTEPTAFGVTLPGLVAGSVAFAASTAASSDSLSLSRGLRPISVRTSHGVTVRAYFASYSGSPRLFERVERTGQRPQDAASATGDALYSCLPTGAIVVEVSDRGYAGAFSIPLAGSSTSHGVSLVAVWQAGVAERSPVEIVVVRTAARAAGVSAALDGRHASATAHGGLVVLALGLSGEQAHGGSVTVRITGASGPVTSQVTVPASGAFAEPLDGCSLVRRAAG